MKRRVVVTGMGGMTPLGTGWERTGAGLREMRSGVVRMDGWDDIKDLKTKLGAPVPDYDEEESPYSRKKTRTMGRVSFMAVRATEMALEDAGLLDSPVVSSGRLGVSYGSTYGSPPAYEEFFLHTVVHRNLEGVKATAFIKFMSHTCAANIAQFFGTKGRIIPTTCACTAGAQGIGYAFEAIRDGYQDVMVAGGADEQHYLSTAVFDLMFATSRRNDEPQQTPRPFDTGRDGLVVGEGAATLVLEDLEHALARGARIHAEILGWGTNCDGNHMVHPSGEGMEAVMRLALSEAGLSPDQIDYVNMHGTATEIGDIEESQATRRCFDRAVPASSIKGYMGHTLGACGAIEAWTCIAAMEEGWVPPNLNLESPDPRCGELDFVTSPRQCSPKRIMSNNFAFGGVNTSLILGKWES
jgi:3-oxoacyl-[acyl-carrier-protein] synthase II